MRLTALRYAEVLNAAMAIENGSCGSSGLRRPRRQQIFEADAASRQ